MYSKCKQYFYQELKSISMKIVFLCCIIITTEIIKVIFPIIGRYIIDNIIPKHNVSLLVKFSIIYLFAYLFYISLKYITTFIATKLQVNIELNMRISIMIEALKSKYFNITIGNAIFTFYNDIQSVSSMFLDVYVSIFKSMLAIIFSSFVLYYIDVRLMILTLIPCPLIYFINKCSLHKIFNLNYKFKHINSSLIDEIKTFWTFRKNIFIFNSFEYFKCKMEKLHKNRNNAFFKAFYYSQLISILQQLVSYLPDIIIFVLSSYWVIDGTMTIGSLIATRVLFENIYRPFQSIITIFPKLQLYRSSIQRIDDCFINSYKSIKPCFLFYYGEKHIKAKNLAFKYNDSTPFVIKNFSFYCNNNCIVKIDADNGRGKSTLFDILVGYLMYTGGELQINNIISKVNLHYDLSALLSYSTQEDAIFNTSVFENCVLDSHFTLEDVSQMWLNLGFYDAFDEKFNLKTIVNAQNLSGGQKKKIALVRVFLHNKDIILLDEPFAQLDKKSQHSLFVWLKKISLEKLILISDHTGNIDSICKSIIKL